MRKSHKANGSAPARENTVSLFVFFLNRLSAWFYRALGSGLFGRIFTAYSSEQAAFEDGFLKNHFSTGTKLKLYFRKLRLAISRSFETSGIVNGCGRLLRGFLKIPLRTFGKSLFSFGIYTVLIYFIKLFIPGLPLADEGVIITGVATCIVVVPMLLSDDSIAVALGKSAMTHSLLVDAFGFREESLESPPKNNRITNNLFVVLGMFLGILTVFMHPLTVLLGIVMLIGLILVFQSPEIGVLSSIAFLPFFSFFEYPSLFFGGLVLLTAISYCIKLLRGKRILKMELMDLSVLLFMAVLFFSGTITAGGSAGYREVLLSTALMCGYFLAVNLIRTEKWLHRCVVALVSSGTVVSILGIFQYIFNGVSDDSWIDRTYFPDIQGRAVSVFENPNVLATYLVVVFPFALYLFTQCKRKNERFLCVLSIVSFVICTILTWTRGAWIAMLLTCLLFSLLYYKGTIKAIFAMLLAIPFLPRILPNSIIKRFTSIVNIADSSATYRIYTWRGTLRTIEDYFWSGIGYGQNSFQAIYPQYAYVGIESAEHSHSLFLQILLGMGIGGLLIFFAMLLLFIQMNFEFIKKTKNDPTRILVGASVFAIVAMLVMGLFDFVWYNSRVFFLFWLIIGLACACVRIKDAESKRHNFMDSSEETQATFEFETIS